MAVRMPTARTSWSMVGIGNGERAWSANRQAIEQEETEITE
jgi:hypothetical protein